MYLPLRSKKGFITKVYQKLLNDELRYKSRIEYLIVDRNFESIVNHALIRENEVLSLLKVSRPFLYEFGKNECYSGYRFWLSCLKHYTDIVGRLDRKSNKNQRNQPKPDKQKLNHYQVAKMISEKNTQYRRCNDWIIKHFITSPTKTIDNFVIVTCRVYMRMQSVLFVV